MRAAQPSEQGIQAPEAWCTSLAKYYGTQRMFKPVPEAVGSSGPLLQLQIMTEYFPLERNLRTVIEKAEEHLRAPAAKTGPFPQPTEEDSMPEKPILELMTIRKYAHGIASALDFLHLDLKVPRSTRVASSTPARLRAPRLRIRSSSKT